MLETTLLGAFFHLTTFKFISFLAGAVGFFASPTFKLLSFGNITYYLDTPPPFVTCGTVQLFVE